eukprot:888093-Pelagomonas_calceolata.AAC.1
MERNKGGCAPKQKVLSPESVLIPPQTLPLGQAQGKLHARSEYYTTNLPRPGHVQSCVFRANIAFEQKTEGHFFHSQPRT